MTAADRPAARGAGRAARLAGRARRAWRRGRRIAGCTATLDATQFAGASRDQSYRSCASGATDRAGDGRRRQARPLHARWQARAYRCRGLYLEPRLPAVIRLVRSGSASTSPGGMASGLSRRGADRAEARGHEASPSAPSPRRNRPSGIARRQFVDPPRPRERQHQRAGDEVIAPEDVLALGSRAARASAGRSAAARPDRNAVSISSAPHSGVLATCAPRAA